MASFKCHSRVHNLGLETFTQAAESYRREKTPGAGGEEPSRCTATAVPTNQQREERIKTRARSIPMGLEHYTWVRNILDCQASSKTNSSLRGGGRGCEMRRARCLMLAPGRKEKQPESCAKGLHPRHSLMGAPKSQALFASDKEKKRGITARFQA